MTNSGLTLTNTISYSELNRHQKVGLLEYNAIPCIPVVTVVLVAAHLLLLFFVKSLFLLHSDLTKNLSFRDRGQSEMVNEK